MTIGGTTPGLSLWRLLELHLLFEMEIIMLGRDKCNVCQSFIEYCEWFNQITLLSILLSQLTLLEIIFGLQSRYQDRDSCEVTIERICPLIIEQQSLEINWNDTDLIQDSSLQLDVNKGPAFETTDCINFTSGPKASGELSFYTGSRL